MTITSATPSGREWRQFRLLAHDSIRRLLSAAMLSRDGDPWQFAIWMTTLVATPSWLYAFGQMFKYAALRRASPALIERVVLGDRMFFIVYAMVAAALLAALTWDALFPDRTDQEIVGVLPVRARTLAAARLAASIAMAVLFAAAINVPGAVFFSLIAATHPLLGHVPIVFVAHVAATVGASVAVFIALLVVRGAAATLSSATVANGIAAVLQIASVGALIESLLYVPSVIPPLVRTMLAGGAPALQLPPVWFAAIYTLTAGSPRPVLAAEAVMGVAALAVTSLVCVAIYLVPADWIARRTLATMSNDHVRMASAATRLASRVAAQAPAVRAMVAFTIASFTRSRRHAFVLLSYLGVAAGLGAVSIIAATVRHTLSVERPAASLLSLPLVIMFFSVLGLRASFGIATDFDANWPFRLCHTRVRQAAAGARLAMLVLAVCPIAIAAGVAASVLGWDARIAAQVALFDLLAGVLLVELLTFGWHAVPFARAYEPAVQTLKWRGPAMLIPLNLFAFRGADLQLATLQSLRALAIYIAMVVITVALVRLASSRESTRQGLSFETEGDDRLAVLNLSESG
jgi:hypothetical protein